MFNEYISQYNRTQEINNTKIVWDRLASLENGIKLLQEALHRLELEHKDLKVVK